MVRIAPPPKAHPTEALANRTWVSVPAPPARPSVGPFEAVAGVAAVEGVKVCTSVHVRPSSRERATAAHRPPGQLTVPRAKSRPAAPVVRELMANEAGTGPARGSAPGAEPTGVEGVDVGTLDVGGAGTDDDVTGTAGTGGEGAGAAQR